MKFKILVSRTFQKQFISLENSMQERINPASVDRSAEAPQKRESSRTFEAELDQNRQHLVAPTPHFGHNSLSIWTHSKVSQPNAAIHIYELRCICIVNPERRRFEEPSIFMIQYSSLGGLSMASSSETPLTCRMPSLETQIIDCPSGVKWACSVF